MSKSLNDCGEPSSQPNRNNDPVKPSCASDDNKVETCSGTDYAFYKSVPAPDDLTIRKKGLGFAYADPIQAGSIFNNKDTSPNYIYPYAQGIRAVDEAMKDLFSDIHVRDDLGKYHKVPIVFGGQEAAIAVILRGNVRKDNTMVTDRILLPIMAIDNESYNMNMANYMYHKAINRKRVGKDRKPGMTISERWERDTVLGFTRGIPVNLGYTLSVWVQYQTDIKQIVEQIFQKMCPVAYIRLRGVTDMESIVKLESVSSNADREVEPGAERVIKMQLGLTAETYIPQAIERTKAVLSTKIDIVDGISDAEIKSVISRLEEVVDEFKNNK